ncbi:hexose transporter [Amylocystis lapponica]|nr:hexose transporter [Amylocystis lapponica]
MTGSGAATILGEGEGFRSLIDPNRTWYNNKRLIRLHAWVVLLVITSSANGFDGSLMNSFQSLQQWETYFDNPKGGKLGLLNAIQNIGSLAGYPFAPYASDYYGRRITIWWGALVMLIGVAVQSAAINFGMFIGARFCIGFGLTFAANSAPMLITEIAYPTYRAPLTSIYNSLWYSGNLIATWTTYGTARIHSTWSWRIPSLLQGLPSMFQFCLILFGPESPRWLVSNGKDMQALQTLAYYHADGDEHDPLVQYEFQEIKAAIELDRASSKNIGWKALVRTPGNKKRMVLIIAIAWFSQWSGNGLVSYYQHVVLDSIGITSELTQLLIGGCLAIWGLLCANVCSLFVDRAGRRKLFLASSSGCLVFFTMQTICTARYSITPTPAAGHAYIAAIFLFSLCYDLAFTPLVVTYTVEILPFSLRAKGLNVYNFIVSIALIFNQYVNPIALDALGWKYYLVYCCWISFEVVFLYFGIVETKGLTLEETAALFDGEDIVAHIPAAAQLIPVQEVGKDDRDYDEKIPDSKA